MVPDPAFTVAFYRSQTGRETVRDWLRSLASGTRQAIGEDLMVLQFRWPLGMPLVRKMGPELWELRSTIPEGIARVFFTVWQNRIVVLHGFIKKSQATPAKELATAKRRLAAFTRSTP